MPGLPCTFPGCYRPHHAKGLCSAHYQQLRQGTELRRLHGDPEPPNGVHEPDWTPPTGMSESWQVQQLRKRLAPRVIPDRTCALEACGGIAATGSPWCPAHKHYRETQERLKAQGLA